MYRTTRLVKIVSLVAALIGSAFTAEAQTPPVVQIMPLGDSLTAGNDGGGTNTVGAYRDALYCDLVASGISFTYVGANNDVNNFGSSTRQLQEANETEDNGFGGYEIADLDKNLNGVFTSPTGATGNAGGYWFTGGNGTGRNAVMPNIVLLQVGANDVIHGNGSEEPGMITNLTTLCQDIHTYAPSATIIVAEIPPLASSGFNSIIYTYNQDIISKVVGTLSYTRLVDNYDCYFPNGDHTQAPIPQLLGLTDGTHPSRYGYTIMASNWAAAIRSVLGVSPTMSSVTVSGGTLNNTAANPSSFPPGSIVTLSSTASPFVSWSASNFAATTGLMNPFSSFSTYIVPPSPTTVTANTTPTGSIIPNGNYMISGGSDIYQFGNSIQSGGLQMTAAGTASGSLAQLTGYSGLATQQWTVNNLGSNVITMAPSGTSVYLEPQGNSTANPANMDVESYVSTDTFQQWTVIASVSGDVDGATRLVNVGSGLPLDINPYANPIQLDQDGYYEFFSFYPVTVGATPPNPPTSVTASTSVSGQVNLNWTASTGGTGGVTSYTIYRGTINPYGIANPGLGYMAVIATGVTTTSYTDKALTGPPATPANVSATPANPGPNVVLSWTASGNRTYYYEVVAVGSGGTSGTGATNFATATPSGGPTVSSYTIYRLLPTQYVGYLSIPPIANGVTTTSYTDTTGTPGQLYYYYVAGTSITGISPDAPAKSATPLSGGGTTYALTVTDGTGGNGAVALSPSGGSYAAGTQVTLTADPKSGYTFSSWTITSGSGTLNTTTASPAILTTAAGATAVTANYVAAPTYSLTVAAGSGGTVASTPASGGMYTAGTAVSVTATPNSGYTFVNWTGAGSTLLANASSASTTLTNGMPASTVSLTANFTAAATYSLTVTAGANGTVTSTPASGGMYTAGTAVSVTATPNSGYTFVNWTGTGSTLLANASAASTTLTNGMPASTVSITANFTASGSGVTFSTPSSATAGSVGLNDSVYHSVPEPPLTAYTAPVDSDITAVDTYAAGHTPAYVFLNSNTGFNYTSSSPVSTYLGADAAGAASTDTTANFGVIYDAIGYINIPTASVNKPFTFAISAADDAGRVLIGGNGTPGTGTVVVERNFVSGTLSYPATQTVTFTQAGLYPIEVLTYQDVGGASFAYTVSGASYTYNIAGTTSKPVVTSGSTSGTVGTSFNYQIVATNGPTGYNATNLPSGLTVNTTTGVISGTPTAAGTTTVALSATNSAGTGTGTLSVTIAAAPPAIPVVTSGSTSGTVGTTFNYQIVATNSPTGYNATNLPSGLTVNTTSGVISGTPTTAGTTTVALSATNAGGTGTGTLSVTISAAPPVAPVVTSGSSSGTVGTAFSYQIVATNSPTGYNATNLPGGLTVNTTSGVISGTPTTAGTATVALSATNAGGTGTGTLSVTIAAAGSQSSIAVQFVGSGTAMVSTDSAGVPAVAQSNWKPLTGYSFSSVALTDNTGAATTASMTGSADGTYFSLSNFTSGTGNAKLCTGELYDGTITTETNSITISAIPYAQYDVYVYGECDSPGRDATFTITPSGGSASSLSFQTESAATAWTAGTSTWNGSGTQPTIPVGNYVHFTGLTASSFNLKFGGVNNVSMNGIQIVKTSTGTSAPVVTSGSTSGTVGSSFNYQIAATNSPTGYNATNLPAGLTVNTTTGVISGTPSAAGTTTVALSATNAGGTGTGTLSVTISAAPPSVPVVTSGSTSGTVGTAFNYQIVASNSPTGYNATNLPAGLTVNTTTGVISGTPSTAGTTTVALSATNAGGTGTGTLSVTIAAVVPAVTSGSTSGTVGTAFNYQIVASNSPTGYNATNLPSGLTVNTTTGVISGTPSTTGTTTVALSATNSAGTGTGTLSVTISAAGAQVSIGMQFVGQGTAIPSTTSAGVPAVAQTHWQALTGSSFSGIALTNNSGAATTASITGSSDGYYFSGSSFTDAGNQDMCSGELYDGNITTETNSVTISSVPYSTYDVYIYGACDAGGRNATFTVTPSGGTASSLSFQTESNGSAWTAGTNTWNGSGTAPTLSPGNYVHFTGLTTTSFTVKFGGAGNVGMNAIQIVKTGP